MLTNMQYVFSVLCASPACLPAPHPHNAWYQPHLTFNHFLRCCPNAATPCPVLSCGCHGCYVSLHGPDAHHHHHNHFPSSPPPPPPYTSGPHWHDGARGVQGLPDQPGLRYRQRRTGTPLTCLTFFLFFFFPPCFFSLRPLFGWFPFASFSFFSLFVFSFPSVARPFCRRERE